MKRRIRDLVMLAAPYIIIIIFPLISVLLLGRMVLSNYHEKIIQDKQRNMNLAYERFLKKVDSLETRSYMLGKSDLLIQYMSAGNKGNGHTVIDDMDVKELLGDGLVNVDVTEVFFYEVKNRRIITANTVLSNAEDYFRMIYQSEDCTPQEYVEQLEGCLQSEAYSLAKNVIIRNKAAQVIEYKVSLPLDMLPSAALGKLVLVIKTEDIFSDFYDCLDTEGEFYVYDSKGNLVFGSGEQYAALLDEEDSLLKALNWNEETVYSMTCGSDGDWKVNIFLPETSLVGSQWELLPSIFLLVLMPNVLGIVCCIYFTFKNHREIQGILTMFRGQMPDDINCGEDEEVGYSIVRKYAEKLVGENVTYRERISEYEILHRRERLNKLIHNEYADHSEVMDMMTEIGLNTAAGKCSVLCIRYKGAYYRVQISENMTAKDMVEKNIRGMLEHRFELFDSSARETVCILFIDETEDIEFVLQDIISRLKVEIAYHCGIEVEMAFGDIVDSIYQIRKSYMQAREVIQYSESSGNEISLYSDLKKMEDRYYYPKDFENRMCNYITLGQTKEAKEIVRKIYEDNFMNSEESPSANVVLIIKNKLKESCVAVAKKYEGSIEDILLQFEKEQGIKDYFEIIYECIDKLAEEIRSKKEERQNQSAMKVINYVNQNYCDSTLSLKRISQEFGFNENYMSGLFRKVYGENFSVVLEELRIKKACELIKNTDDKISDIAQAVGYISDITFRRAFKRVMGVTPGEFRDI